MIRSILSSIAIGFLAMALMPAINSASSQDSHWAQLVDVAFENYDLEPAVLTLVNDNNVPVSHVIKKARNEGYGPIHIIDTLIETKLSYKQAILEALQNDLPPAALFDSKKIRDDYEYTPDDILRLLVQELRFMEQDEARLGEEERNLNTRERHFEIIVKVGKSMLDDEDYSQYDVMYNLCQAGASSELMAVVAKRLDVPTATALKACPKHAEYGHAYISHELPQEAHIVIGVDHKTLDDSAGRGIISPKTP